MAFSPSGYDRWSKCSASENAIIASTAQGLIPEDDRTDYSVEGDIAHEIFAGCLDLQLSPRELIGKTVYVETTDEDFCVTPEMGESLDLAFERVMDFVSPGAQVYVEQCLPLDKVLPSKKGTVDCVIVPHRGTEIHVLDLKYGKGKHVEVVDNHQTKLYAIGVLDNLVSQADLRKIKTVVLHILQPRTNNIAMWSISIEDLERFRVQAHRKYLVAIDPAKGRYAYGKHCWFCDTRFRCRHLISNIFNLCLENRTGV